MSESWAWSQTAHKTGVIRALTVGGVLILAAAATITLSINANAAQENSPDTFTFVVRDSTPEEIAEAIKEDGGRADAEMEDYLAKGSPEGKKARDAYNAELDERERLEREADEFEAQWRTKEIP